MDIFEKFIKVLGETNSYPIRTELLYKHGFSQEEIKVINKYKHKDSHYVKLALFNDKDEPLLFWNNDLITSKFYGSHELIKNSQMNLFSDYQDSEIINGFIFSEIESNLAIEGIRSTRAQIMKLNKADYNSITNSNDIIIKNMILGYEFVKTNKITENNIFKLYEILSKNTLKTNEKLLVGNYYRHDYVNIVDSLGNILDKGVNHNLLPKLINQLIDFINLDKSFKDHLISSHIIHYYFVYLHPYFDLNGRMARMLSFWYNYQFAPSLSLLIMSEAINNKINKKGYYNAIDNSRKANNDISFFLEFMGKITLNYTKIYINYYGLLQSLKNLGKILNRSIDLALKNVLIISQITNNQYFDWKTYKNYTSDDFSKQYYLRLLNSLVDLKVLDSVDVKNTKLFKINNKKWDLLP